MRLKVCQLNVSNSLLLYRNFAKVQLYEDDGHTFGYERGEFAVTRLEIKDSRLMIHQREGKYITPKRKIVIRLHGFENKELIEVEDDGEEKKLILSPKNFWTRAVPNKR